MALKEDIKKAFENNLSKGGSIKDISKSITDAYKKSVELGTDFIGNNWEGITYPAIQQSIESQFNLSYSTRSYLQFNLIEQELIKSWSNASIKLFAIPAPGMSLVTSGVVVYSTPPGTTPLIEASKGYDNIVNKFYDMFTKHSKSLSFMYIGLAITGTPPPPISIPVTTFTIK